MKKSAITVVCQLLCCLLSSAQTSTNLVSWYNSVKSSAKAVEKAAYATKMLESSDGQDQKSQFLIDAAIQIVATTFADEQNYKEANAWMDKTKDANLKNGTFDYIVSLLISNKKFAEAHKMLDPKIVQFKKDEYGNMITIQEELMSCLSYGRLLFNEGKFLNALPYLYPAMSMPKHVERYKELYIQAMIKGKPKDLTKDVIKTVYQMPGKRSESFKSDVNQWFVQNDGNEKEYKMLESATTLNEKQRLEDLVTKMAVNQPAPDFEVKDINGTSVSLSSLKGKTVILDFWATWCQPCVASFPGMQKAVNYFKNDPSVVFMFIHTMEKKGGNLMKDIDNLMGSKGYNLPVYLDTRDPNTSKSPVAEKFNIRAIPAKFVINKEGVIKFSNTGYVGEDDAIDEIKLMIEKANKI